MRPLEIWSVTVLLWILAVSEALAQSAPVLYEGGVVNGADYTAELAPGAIMSLWGESFSQDVYVNDQIPVRRQMGGLQVEVIPPSGEVILAPLFLVSPGQINAQLPFGVSGSVRIRVRNAAGVSAERTINLSPTAPKLFTWTMDGRGQPIALHADYSAAVPASPLRPGDWAILWLTGLGAVEPPLEAGHPGGDTIQYGPLSRVMAEVTVSVGGKTVRPAFAGAAPGFAGLYQINFQIPADTPPGLQSCIVTAGGHSSQANVSLVIDYPGEILASQQIGPEGGTISGGGASLQVPAGSFTGTTRITITRILTQPSDAGSLATGMFRISGFPLSYSAPLILTLPLLAGSGPPEDLVAFVRVEGDQSVGESPKGIPATVQDGYVKVVIPALPEDASSLPTKLSTAVGRTGVASPREAIVQSSTMTHLIWAMAGLKWHTSNSGRFRIYAPDGVYDTVRAVAACLDSAWTRLSDMGLETSRRETEIPVFLYSYRSRLAKLFGKDTDNAGASESDIWGDQNVGLTLNLDVLTGSGGVEAGCVTAGHELMHIAQGLYDPRGRARRTFTHTPWLWMLEASATWFERAVSSNPNYLPANLRNNLAAFFYTPLEVQPGWWSGDGARTHGYAASALLQAIDPVSRDSGGSTVANVLKLMEEKESGYLYDSSKYSPTQALILAYSGLSSMWGTFARNFAEGKVFSGTKFPDISDWLGYRSQLRTIRIESGSTSPNVVDLKLGDLSIHPVMIEFAQWTTLPDEGTPVVLKLADPSGRAGVHLYRIAGSGLEFVQTFASRYTYQTANDLVRNGASLLAVVYQSRAVAPFTQTTPVTLTIQVGDDIMSWLQQSRSVSVDVSAQVACTGGTCGAFGPATFAGSFLGSNFSGKGKKDNNFFPPFTPDFDSRDDTDLDYDISANFNGTGTRMTNLTLTLKRTASRQSGQTTLETKDDVTLSITGVNLSYSNYKSYDETSRVFQFKASAGSSLPAAIQGKTVYRTLSEKGEILSERTVNYNGFVVTPGNVIDVRFSK